MTDVLRFKEAMKEVQQEMQRLPPQARILMRLDQIERRLEMMEQMIRGEHHE